MSYSLVCLDSTYELLSVICDAVTPSRFLYESSHLDDRVSLTFQIGREVIISTSGADGTKDAANQEVRRNESSLRYILLPNWAHDALLETTLSKPYDESNTQVPEGSGNPNSTASTFNPPAEQMETLTVESPIPTVSSPVPTACLNDFSEPSSE
nr:hypothetical protein [Tanacetum cinerariifolium]